MPNTILHSPANVTRHLLIDLGLGTDPEASNVWPIYAEGEPDAPDNVITIYTTAGGDDGRSMIDGEVFGPYGIQIRVRSATPSVGWTKMDAIWTALNYEVNDRTVDIDASKYTFQCFSKIGDILCLGKDVANSKRNLFTLNALAYIEQYL